MTMQEYISNNLVGVSSISNFGGILLYYFFSVMIKSNFYIFLFHRSIIIFIFSSSSSITGSSLKARFISLLAVLHCLFTRSRDFTALRAHLVANKMFQIFCHISRILSPQLSIFNCNDTLPSYCFCT